jgi:hypothetical protein
MVKSIFFISPVGFSDLQQRHQAFAQMLAHKGFRVIFLEPFLSNGFSLRAARQSRNLTIIRLRLPFTAREHPVLQKLACNLAIRLVRHHLHPENQLLWLAEPAAANLVKLPFAIILYDRCDHHGYFPGQRLAAWQSYEKQIFEQADLITYTHHNLATDMPAAAKRKALLVGNACAPYKFTATPAKKDEAKIKILSSGAHYEWVDFKWLNLLISQQRIELHIAGTGRGKDFSELISRSNVIFHGKLPHEKLASLMAGCHGGVVPFLESPLTRSVDPIKAYEYTAAGLQIWAPDIAGLRQNPLIDQRITDSTSLAAALKKLKESRQAKSRTVPTWQQRLNRILDRLAQMRSD